METPSGTKNSTRCFVCGKREGVEGEGKGGMVGGGGRRREGVGGVRTLWQESTSDEVQRESLLYIS